MWVYFLIDLFLCVKASDQSAYYTCDDHSPLVEKSVTTDLGHDQNQSVDCCMNNSSCEATLNSEGTCSNNLMWLPVFPLLIYIVA